MVTITDLDLLILDVDGTIVNRKEYTLLPVAADFLKLFAGAPARPQLALVTNQGGVAVGMWMRDEEFGNPDSYPTIDQVRARLAIIQTQIPVDAELYVSFAWRNEKTRQWAPTPIQYAGQPEWGRAWRKPNPGMIQQAMQDALVMDPSRVLFVGDTKIDKGAAVAAGVHFMYATRFWAMTPRFLALEEV